MPSAAVRISAAVANRRSGLATVRSPANNSRARHFCPHLNYIDSPSRRSPPSTVWPQGGGCNLALGCDVVFAGASARFAQVFVNRGLAVDYGGTWLLPRLIGLQKAKDLAFRGDVIDSQEALRLGLALEVVADDQLMKRVGEYARVLASKPPIALSMIKTGMNRLMAAGFEEGLEFEADAQAVCLGSADFRTAMIAWLKKTEGHYVGE